MKERPGKQFWKIYNYMVVFMPLLKKYKVAAGVFSPTQATFIC